MKTMKTKRLLESSDKFSKKTRGTLPVKYPEYVHWTEVVYFFTILNRKNIFQGVKSIIFRETLTLSTKLNNTYTTTTNNNN